MFNWLVPKNLIENVYEETLLKRHVVYGTVVLEELGGIRKQYCGITRWIASSYIAHYYNHLMVWSQLVDTLICNVRTKTTVLKTK